MRRTETTFGSASSLEMTVLNVGRSGISMLISMTVSMVFLSLRVRMPVMLTAASASTEEMSRIRPLRSKALRRRSTG